jgi:hypothetical protein
LLRGWASDQSVIPATIASPKFIPVIYHRFVEQPFRGFA